MSQYRKQLRVQALIAFGILLLSGAGEVLGACYCDHRGGPTAESHGQHEMAAAEHGHAPESHDGSDSRRAACRALCALGCTVSLNVTPDVTQRVRDLLVSARAGTEPPVESMDRIPATARPHILPLSQAPPTNA